MIPRLVLQLLLLCVVYEAVTAHRNNNRISGCVSRCPSRRFGYYPSCSGCQFYAKCVFGLFFDRLHCPPNRFFDGNYRRCRDRSSTCTSPPSDVISECVKCRKSSVEECNESTDTDTCGSPHYPNDNFACFTEIKNFGSTTKVSKGCLNKRACRKLEARNGPGCDGAGPSGPGKRCVFCCDDEDLCNTPEDPPEPTPTPPGPPVPTPEPTPAPEPTPTPPPGPPIGR